MSESNPLDAAELQQLGTLMRRLQSPIPTEIFPVFAARFPSVAIEAVILRKIDDVVHVLLTQRPPDDPVWPNMWHSPGSLVRATDGPAFRGVVGTFHSVFKRIQNDEIGATFVSDPMFVCVQFQQVTRGTEIALVHVAEIKGEPTSGTFFPVDALPENFIEHQRVVIKAAVDAWCQN